MAQAMRVASPNFNERPEDAEISLLVIHAMSLPPGVYETSNVDALFCNRLDPAGHPYFESIQHLQVSSHLLIDRQGGLRQYVDFAKRAWHAGASVYEGRQDCNDFSIGIELLGDEFSPYTDAQYDVLARLTCSLMAQYPAITPTRVVGHQHVAVGRKTDPGQSFDWPRFRAHVADELYKE